MLHTFIERPMVKQREVIATPYFYISPLSPCLSLRVLGVESKHIQLVVLGQDFQCLFAQFALQVHAGHADNAVP